jgi:UDP-GlcNAc:undecaprenyl-phosphate GlcNAc-1-phosphate transferase
MIVAFSFIGAMFVTMVLLPPLMRFAGPLSLLDEPDQRKVHTEPVPRCGGLAIAVGMVLPLLMWLPLDRPLIGLLGGGLIVFLFGLWDDVKDLNYKIKLFGQILALIVVMQAGVVLRHAPFAGLDAVSIWIQYPLTALFVLGVTNAVNLSDGLDGLAAGCTMLTLGMIAVIAYQAGSVPTALLAVTVMGGILGFLRYNTFPAIVFLGDAGSQLFGFVTATLSVYLIEDVNSALSPALPLLLLGFPILDTIWVMVTRMRHGHSPFLPDRNHIHHRLLGLGLRHYEAVSLIYVMHGALICSAYLLRYYSDALIAGVYAAFCVVVVGTIVIAEWKGWRVRPVDSDSATADRRNIWLRQRSWLPRAIMAYLTIAVPLFLVFSVAMATNVPRDAAVVAIGTIGVVIAGILFVPGLTLHLVRAGVYITGVLAVFLLTRMSPESWAGDFLINAYCAFAALLLIVGLRLTRRNLFRVTPQDLLIVFFALVIPNLTADIFARLPLTDMAFRLLIVFYITEFLLFRDKQAVFIDQGLLRVTTGRVLGFASLAVLAFVAVRGYAMI